MMAKKERADQLLCENGLADTREGAKRCIMAGLVFYETADGRTALVEKPGTKYPLDTVFQVKGRERFVSRGAYKLLTALEGFSLPVAGAVALDAGASTGGFTDCLLQHGAVRVYAVDVGHNQLHEKLRTDPRVVSMEKTNLRDAPVDLLPELVDIVTADVSFISLTLVLPGCVQFLKPGGYAAALIKPQFELGPDAAPKGVVRDEALQLAAVEKVTSFAARELALELVGVLPAAVKGPKGNQEYMAVWRKSGSVLR
ncbi:putative rRNA methyltransferase YqxC [uncultured delta proteobacterium]|uniref:Putative rRNA methyltransferase YqxC n=1 Tax=uncultured delta proteobacterium TaxID=34034 RepID=A0A212J1H1_9DELT|nr:putative rRNA methyltransferase YqxC [uncultured delta proteobacterium]